VIDLDAPVRDSRPRPLSRRGPVLFVIAAMTVAGLAGEPVPIPVPVPPTDDQICEAVRAAGTEGGGGVVVMDPAAGKIYSVVTCAEN
jgi:hypothetical protein